MLSSKKNRSATFRSRNRRAVASEAVKTVLETLEGRRLLSAGSLDSSFNSANTPGYIQDTLGPSFGAAIGSVAIDSGTGDIIVAGSADGHIAIARYHSDGTPDTSFVGDGGVTTPVDGHPGVISAALTGFDFVQSIVIRPDGKIIASGTVEEDDGNFDLFAMALNSNGSTDSSFDPTHNGVTIIQADGDQFASDSVLSGNTVYVIGSGEDNADIAKFDAGGLDTSFGTGGLMTVNGLGSNMTIHAGTLQAGGKLVVVGDNDADGFLARIDLGSGSVDPTFGTGGIVQTPIHATDDYNDIAQDSSGRLLALGTYIVQGGAPFVQQAVQVQRFSANGALDTTFGGVGGAPAGEAEVLPSDPNAGYVAKTYLPSAMAIDAQGRIDITGTTRDATGANEVDSLLAVRFTAAGAADGSFGTNGVAINTITGNFDGGSGIAIQGDGKIVVGGSAEQTDFLTARYIADANTNHAPVASDDSYTTNEDTPLTVTAPGVLGNDTDADNDSLQAILVSGPQHGSLTLNADGSLLYTPASLYSGSDSFTYKANDGHTDSNIATVGITVSHVNHAPAANSDTYTTNEDAPLTISAPGVLNNDTDVDNDALHAVLVSGPQHGTLTLNADGSLLYTPNTHFSGADSFTYKANDGSADSNVATVGITVSHVNHQPVLTPINPNWVVSEGGAVNFTASASDVDGDPLTFSLLNGPAGASIDPQTGAFHFGAVDGPASYNFSVVVTDPGQLSDQQQVSIQVNNVAPTASITNVPSIHVLPGTPITLGSSVSDPGTLDTFTYSWNVTKNGNAFASGTASSITFTPDAVGSYAVSLVVTDKDGSASTPATASVQAIASSVSGIVYNDANNNGQVELGEAGLPGVTVHLSGTDDLGASVSRTLVTDADGAYVFLNLRPGTYSLSETQPAGYNDGLESLGTAGGTITVNGFNNISLAENQDGFNYNFGEQAILGTPVQPGQAAQVGFWQNKNGQNLIKSLNGNANATNLGNWLAATFPHMFGVQAGANNLAGKTNTYIASFYQEQFKLKGQKLDANVLAVALSAYVTNSTLAGSAGTSYGFIVDSSGLGAATYNVGTNGAAFGVANGTTMRVIDLLTATDSATVGGVLYGTNSLLRQLAYNVYSGINSAGNIA